MRLSAKHSKIHTKVMGLFGLAVDLMNFHEHLVCLFAILAVNIIIILTLEEFGCMCGELVNSINEDQPHTIIMKYTITILAVVGLLSASASAASIAMNFAENAANQVFAGGENIGPTGINSSNWNSSISRDSGSLATGEIGTVNTLIDDTGASTTATVSWSSNNVFFNSDGTVGDEAKLAVGYLDDSTGASFTVSNIPYASYSVYVLFTSDQNGDYQHGALTVAGTGVLGGGDFNAHGRVTDGTGWVEADGTVFGNYVKVDGLTNSTLNVSSIRNGAARGPITGFILVESVPEPSSAALLGLGGLALIFRRRK